MKAEMPAAVDIRATARDEGDATFGMTVFLGTWVMLFAALFLAYGVVRAQAESWPSPGEPRLPLGLPGLATLLILSSSVALRRGLGRARAGDRVGMGRGLVLTAALGAAFLGLQAVGWRQLADAGLRPGSSLYGSVFFAFTLFHALHVACGLALLGWLGVRIKRTRTVAPRLTAARLTAAFWDFVAIVWALMYLTVYVW